MPLKNLSYDAGPLSFGNRNLAESDAETAEIRCWVQGFFLFWGFCRRRGLIAMSATRICTIKFYRHSCREPAPSVPIERTSIQAH